MTVRVDSATFNYAPLKILKNYLKETYNSITGGQCLFVRCAANILTLIVTNYLKDVDDSIARVRILVGVVKSSPTMLDKFKIVTSI